MKLIISSIVDRFKTAPEGHKIFRGIYHEGKGLMVNFRYELELNISE